MRSYGWPAPAKLNLMLHIIGRRKDGLHLLQTAFQFLNYGDILDFKILPSREIRLAREIRGIKAENNLVVRAGNLLQKYNKNKLGAEIFLHKYLPVGAGLGGGSSDAATTLVALNYLLGIKIEIKKLAEIGLCLGADIPVFIYGHAAWAQGIGEKLLSANFPIHWFLIIRPDIKISTKELFNDVNLVRNSQPITVATFLTGIRKNSFFPIVCKKYPIIADLANQLAKLGEVQMTGTGSCLFLSFTSKKEAQKAKKNIPHKWKAFISCGVNTSPLIRRLEIENTKQKKKRNNSVI